MHMGDGVYRFITCMASVVSRSCPWCGKWFEKLKQHMQSRACLKCKRCQTKFGSLQALHAHQETCDADDKRALLKDKHVMGVTSNDYWLVWDLESMRGSWRGVGRLQVPVMACAKLSPALTKVLNEGSPLVSAEGEWASSFATDADALWTQFLSLLDAIEERLGQHHKWEAKACTYADRTVRCRAFLQTEEGVAYLKDAGYTTWKKWEAGTKVEDRIRFYNAHVLNTTIHTTAERSSLYEKAEEEYRKLYESKLGDYRSQCQVVCWAHNSGKYDSNLLIQVLVRHDRVFSPQPLPAEDDDGKVAAADVEFIKNHGSYIQVTTHRKLFTFKDSRNFLASGLRSLGRDFFKEAEGKGDWPYSFDTAQTVSDADVEFKPPQDAWIVEGEPQGPMKHRRKRPMDDAQYRAIPGKDPQLPRTVGELRGRVSAAASLGQGPSPLDRPMMGWEQLQSALQHQVRTPRC